MDRSKITQALIACLLGAGGAVSLAQVAQPLIGPATAQDFHGGVPTGTVEAAPIHLTLDDAITRGLRQNLGLLLSRTQTATVRGQQLQQLQNLLPKVDANLSENLMETDLAAEGLRVPGFPTIIGPFGYTDVRANLNWTALSLNSLHNYLASKHDFRAAQLTADDARQMVILTVGNAYLMVVADQSEVDATQAEVATSKTSLDQSTARHDAGTAPKLDVLRAQVDYQTHQQQLIVARNQLVKDKLALARAIGLPMAQEFTVADSIPYQAFDQPDVRTEIRQALATRKDRQASAQTTASMIEQRKAATADRLPTVKVSADYGDIGVNLNHSHGTSAESAVRMRAPVWEP